MVYMLRERLVECCGRLLMVRWQGDMPISWVGALHWKHCSKSFPAGEYHGIQRIAYSSCVTILHWTLLLTLFMTGVYNMRSGIAAMSCWSVASNLATESSMGFRQICLSFLLLQSKHGLVGLGD